MADPLRLAVAALLAVSGTALVTVAVLGARGRLPRNRFAGVRTAATLRSEAGFALAHRVAAAPLAAAGGVALLGAAAAAFAGGGTAGWVLAALAALGTVLLAGIGGTLGDRAAQRLAAQDPAPSACTGTCAGCSLVAGCGTPAEEAR
ncbi:MAG: SdpI family protein [Pseudonocardia sp.]